MAQSILKEKVLSNKLPSFNPGTRELISEVDVLDAEDMKSIVQRTKQYVPIWQKTSFKDRAKLCFKLRKVIHENLDEIAELISKENGKPIMEAITHDIMPVMDLITYFSKNVESILKSHKINLGKWNFLGHQSHIEYYPLGVIGIISPWNFPFSIPVGEMVMALLVGNVVILKPSEHTPLIGQKIGELFKKAGFPDDVIQVIQGDGMVGASLVTSGVDKIAFTGSVPTGKKIMEAAAKSLTPVTLELGGKDPFIVLPDANIDLASSAAVWGAFCNSGQVCASVERVYVHEDVAEEFTKLVVEKTQKIKQGIGLDLNSDMGPMTMSMQLKKVMEQINAAKKNGAKILTGGEVNSELSQGDFIEPTVITDIDHNAKIIQEETFGPVLPIIKYKDIEDAITKANSLPYALNAYIWSKNTSKAKKLASKIEAGTVNINDSVFTHAVAQTPWGGPKESGIGRTHGGVGLLDLVHMRHVHVNHMSSKFVNFWWFGYSPEKVELMKAMVDVLFGSFSQKIKSSFKFLKLMMKVKTR